MTRLDENGYPDEADLDRIRRFHGTPAHLVDFIEELFEYGSFHTEDRLDDFEHPVRAVRLATGGWSGCEDVIAALDGTMFHSLFWSLSARGGLTVYEIGHQLLHTETYWGRPEFAPPPTV